MDTPPPGHEARPMEAARQLLNARIQLAAAGARVGAYHWDIHSRDLAVLQATINAASHLLGIPIRKSDEPALLGAGPVLRRDLPG